jgi:hypothetical protein
MARIYRQSFEGVLVSAAQDLIFIPGSTAGKLVKILRRAVGATDTTIPTSQMLQLRERFLPATVTAGTGGTTGATPVKNDPGDATCGITTAGTNNTTKATTSGTAVILWENGVHIFNGFDDPVLNPYPIANGEAYVFELLSVVSGTVHLSGYVEFSEEGA